MQSNKEVTPGNPGGLGGLPPYIEFERLVKELLAEVQRIQPNGGIVLTYVAPGAQNIQHLGTQVINQGAQHGATVVKPTQPNGDSGTDMPMDTTVNDRIRLCIAQLMTEWYGNEPLFNQQSHWQAIYRILVDKGYCSDSDFDGFDTFIQRCMPDKVNKPYAKASVKQISQTDFGKHFDLWRFDPETSKTRKPFDRMVAVAQRFKELLEQNGL